VFMIHPRFLTIHFPYADHFGNDGALPQPIEATR
jgi:hypothetical protein